jgi:hypothetical protein
LWEEFILNISRERLFGEVTSTQDINLFVVQEELEKSFTLNKTNIPFL